MYEDNASKFVVVLNTKISMPKLSNAMLHAMIGLVSSRLKSEDIEIADYSADDQRFGAFISRFPVIVLEAKNGNQLKTLYEQASVSGLQVNPFVGQMIGASHADQIGQVAATPWDDLDFWVVVLFGDATALQPLTKKFSVLRERDVCHGQ